MEISSEEELARPARPNVLVSGTPGTGKSATCEVQEKRMIDRLVCLNLSLFVSGSRSAVVCVASVWEMW
jgi:hypothetical protein